ncbi:MAG: bifunctional UDP-N-acetylglucosamine diphosphorylase/glucosamine-1-phosphate N-acetyltransferase GlmU [Candidatus Accumulibacter phosphatis]|jgi:bifunctional UDP-N-acetylglucosamine pyrophosphorylase/glucosamine-1-phosphate N-acetyltransferase|uniref:Bifunctional protein GlmU n=2 Tax=Candidatus Accumulibacter TaxID=327159 RepID=A0A080M285_9PROT|nr:MULTISPECIES: bifunctional UDP-N-acetylglucosamine diphosphorylase/glucosamine-1-phosphate N-acetyltransferase GlmU [Candidatus Accumulibacter]KFB71264.1 MAG: Bifunctional protein GlmU [Candidatus Accumulibacter phosphatis]MBL8406647.1 bifunctional UDP-N-acetylglucosamine diphosphorylase/glucosamine-1-phosphate N-acetyltransferase GlmU [Accumulibacter sp.]NMQ04767.1 UDP-N-acetylglucosamine diphosphorylase/glucosamine-1-phosphate N-acetyltransferase [Candidatus Accumulibacter contiguus]HRF134
MNIVILAAGQGKRMHSNLPKVLHPLAGKALLAHVLDTARSLVPQRLCVVYGHGGEAVRTTIDAPDLLWVLQEPQLGTGHAVMQVLPHLDAAGTTLVLYGDVPLLQAGTLKQLVHAARDALAILTVELADPDGYGRIVRNAAGEVVRIVEQNDASAAERAIREVNTGIVALPTAHLSDWLGRLSNDNAQQEYYLTDIVGMAVAAGVPIRTTQAQSESEVLGVNSKGQLARLERVAQLRTAERLMEQGVRLADPARIDVRGELLCGRDVFIDVNCVFEGRVVLEEAVEVGPACVLKNARIGAGSRLAAFSHIEDAMVGPDGVIGPFARLRPGTELAAGVHVGNFVEIKNSKFAALSKANHLAYVGDAVVGSRVNIGAGTITCNYDGANKFKTIIEDDAFIGSDTQLVAPVTVGRGATLGAGTTLTKDAPPDTLTIARARQISIPGWKRPQKK